MNNTIVKQEVENFLNRANSLLESSRLLSYSNQLSHHSITQIYLNFLCFELIIKSFWMMEKDEKAPNTHDVYKLFTQLSDKTKDCIEKSFYSNAHRKEIFNKLQYLIKKHKNEELPEEDFTRILENGENVVKNFIYNKSSVKNPLGGQHLDFLDTLKKQLLEKLN